MFIQKMKKNWRLILAIRIYSHDIEIEFVLGKCAMSIMKSVSRKMMEGIELINQERIKTLGEHETFLYS